MGNFSYNLCHKKTLRCKLQERFHMQHPIFQPVMQQNYFVTLRVARRVELSSTFCNVVRQVAVCDISVVPCNAISLK